MTSRRRLALLVAIPLAAALVALVPTLAHAAGPNEFDALREKGWLWVYLGVFAAGFVTSLTPCVYPMIPIVVGIFGARDEKISRLHAFFLATMYVLGMGVTYSVLGVVVALIGAGFGTFMANPWVIIPIVLLYAALAASMFGAFEMNLPSSLQAKLSTVGGKGTGGAFGMGLVGGLTAAPCTGPMLAGILAYVAAARNVTVGFTLMFTYAIGMGVLFWGIAAFALSLPKSGRWMDSVKSVAGVALLAVGLYFLRPIIPGLARLTSPSTPFLFGAAGIVVAGLVLGAIHLSFHGSTVERLRKGTGVGLCLVGLLGVVNWTLTPKRPLPWRHDEKAAFLEAKTMGSPVLVDFGADWCLPCKEYENKIFSDPTVHAEVRDRFVPLKFDVSKNTDEDYAARERYTAKALPTVILFDAQGKELMRFTEPVPTPDAFLEALRAIR